MPNDNTHDTTAGEAAEPRDPGVEVRDTAGGEGDGANARDPASRSAGGDGNQAGERDPAKARAKPADNPQHDDDTTSTDDSIDLGDVLDQLTNPKPEKATETSATEESEADTDDGEGEDKPDDEPQDDEGADAEKDEAKEEGDDEKPDDDAEADEDEPTDEERKRLSKAVNRKVDRLLKLKPLARIAQDIEARAIKGFPKLADLQRWIDTGVKLQTATDEEATQEAVNLALTVATNGKAAKMSPDERAQRLRELADRIAPAPTPRVITLPDELREAVEAKVLSPEEAQRLALERIEAKEGKPKQPAEKAAAKREEEPNDERARAEPQGWTREEHAAGVASASKVYREYEKKYPHDWKRIGKDVVKRVGERAPMVHPDAYAQLVRDQIEIVLGPKLAAAKPKTPPKSPTPSARREAERPNAEPESEDELLEMITGNRPFPKRR